MSYAIRRFRDPDTAELLALFYQTVHTVNLRDYTPEQLRAWAPDPPERMDQRAWADALGAKHTLVAETEDGTLIGFTNLEPMEGSEDGGHIDHFFCHKDFQGVGVGKALYAAVEAEARRRGMTRLLVEASITARPFFERKGFTVITEQTVERFGVGLTNFRMVKALDASGGGA